MVHASRPIQSRTGWRKPAVTPGAPAPRLDLARAGVASQVARYARNDWAQVGALLGLAILLRLWLSLHGWPAMDSDEAVLGLGARHILAGSFPIFLYGQHYLGALEAYVAVPFFLVFGPTVLALRLSMLVLTLPFVLLVYLLGRAAYGHAVGLVAMALVAVGPAYGLLRELAATAGHPEALVVGAALPLLAYVVLRRPARPLLGWRAWLRSSALYAGIGLVAGLGYWADQLTLPFIVMTVLALVIGRARETLRWPGAALVAGFVVGCAPFLIYNLQHGWITFHELSEQSLATQRWGPFPLPAAWAAQIGSMLSVGLPAVLGSPYVCVSRGDVWGNYPPALAAAGASPGGWCGGLNVLFSLAVLVCYAVCAWQLASAIWAWWRTRRLPRRGHARGRPADAALQARTWLRAILLVCGVSLIGLYTLSDTAQSYQFTAARYLLPVYCTLPIVVGVLWEAATPARDWLLRRAGNLPARWSATAAAGIGPAGAAARSPATRGGTRGRFTRTASATRATVGTWTRLGTRARPAWLRQTVAALAAGLLAVMLAFSLYSGVASAVWATNAQRYALPAPPVDQTVIRSLEAHDISLYVSDYWTCYRLAFESGERLRCAVRDTLTNTLTRNGAVNRYLPYLLEVERAPHPAYIWYAGSAQDRTFDAWAASQQLPHTGYARYVVAGYAVYYYPTGQR